MQNQPAIEYNTMPSAHDSEVLYIMYINYVYSIKGWRHLPPSDLVYSSIKVSGLITMSYLDQYANENDMYEVRIDAVISF